MNEAEKYWYEKDSVRNYYSAYLSLSKEYYLLVAEYLERKKAGEKYLELALQKIEILDDHLARIAYYAFESKLILRKNGAYQAKVL